MTSNSKIMLPAKKEAPIKYFFFMTANESWLHLANGLHEDGVATPVLWLGDDRHYEAAANIFGNSVVRMLDFVHKPIEIPSVNYLGEYSEFFETSDYLDAKDICLKMMDRLDLNGSFARIDREVYFHKLLIWALKFFHDNSVDAAIMIEKPHSHAQYLIYRVARYLNIPTAHFKDCALMPVNFLQNSDGAFIKNNNRVDSDLLHSFEKVVDDYVDTLTALKKSKSNYSPHYMIAQQKNALLINKVKGLFSKKSFPLIRDFVSDINLALDKKYRPTNPYRHYFISRFFIKKRRQKNLSTAVSNSFGDVNFDSEYYYFPLHYEPERTTNPDGEAFHDQFKALVLLRGFLPKSIEIIVKEHPSQFLMADRGSRGRSPLLYQLINNLQGVTLANTTVSSFELIRQSCGVATITGSVALEGALLGKPAIMFGQAWYAGCPNITSWSELDGFESLMKRPIASSNHIRKFLVKLIQDYGVPMVNNAGQLNLYRERWFDELFMSSQNDGMRGLIETFFEVEVKQKSKVS